MQEHHDSPPAAEKDAARLRADLEKTQVRIERLQKRLPKRTVWAKDIVWIFGAGRTGSTWLSNMMGEMPGHKVWFEPMVGELFDPDRLQIGKRPGRDFVFSKSYRRYWLNSVKNFVLDSIAVRFPKGAEVLVVKEPHGSIGAPLLSAAMPKSRLVLLVRDPRDAVASALDRYLNGPWQGGGGGGCTAAHRRILTALSSGPRAATRGALWRPRKPTTPIRGRKYSSATRICGRIL